MRIIEEDAGALLFNLLLEQLDFALQVDVIESFQILVADLFHVKAVDRAHVDALLAADALRVVELRDDDRLAFPIVRAVQHVDAAGRTFALALAAADADVHLQDGVLADAVDQDDLLVRVLLRHPELVRAVVQVLSRIVREFEFLGEVPRVRRAVFHAVPAEQTVPDVDGGPPDDLLHLVELRSARVEILGRRLDLVELEVDAFVRTDLRAQLTADALEPVDAVLASKRQGELDLLIRVEVRDGLAASRDQAVDPRHRDQRLLDRRQERADGAPDRSDFRAGLSFGLGGLHTCTRPSACPSAVPRAR